MLSPQGFLHLQSDLAYAEMKKDAHSPLSREVSNKPERIKAGSETAPAQHFWSLPVLGMSDHFSSIRLCRGLWFNSLHMQLHKGCLCSSGLSWRGVIPTSFFLLFGQRLLLTFTGFEIRLVSITKYPFL